MAVRTFADIISLCTGGGGLDLGVELAMQCARSVVLVEREAFAVGQLVSAMQEGVMAPAPIWGDVTTFSGRQWRGLVDGLIGGVPCQPHSVAGKRLGEDDERDLWSDARRIIAQARPWFVFIENVRGMLSSGGAERVWRDLRRMGFDVEGGLFTAAEVGASHDRERIFILAAAAESASISVAHARRARLEGGERDGAPGEWDRQAASGSIAEFRRASLDASLVCAGSAAYDNKPRSIFPPPPNDLQSWADVIASAPELEPAFRRVADGLASRLDVARVDRLRMLGNGVVPLQAAYAIRTLAHRLAARGSAGATRLVRMMEISKF